MTTRLFLTLAAALTLGACDRSTAPAASSQGSPAPLVIGTDATYPPFEFKDEHGELAGVDVDMGRALAKHLNRPVEFKNIAWEGIIPALQSSRVDIVISSMTATDERRQSLDFSDPYVSTGICLLVPKNSTLNSVDDLKHGKRRVVVKIATTGEVWSRAHLPDAVVTPYDTDSACVLEIQRGNADAWIYDQISVMNWARRNPDTTKALLKPIREERWAIALRKDQPELREQINAFLTAFRADGGFTRLADKYMAEERALMAEQGLPFVFDLPKAASPR